MRGKDYDYVSYSPVDECVIDKNTTHKLTMCVGESIEVPDARIGYYWDNGGKRHNRLGAKLSNKKVVRWSNRNDDKYLYAKKPGKCTVTFYIDNSEIISDGPYLDPSDNHLVYGSVYRHHIQIVKYKITVVKKPKIKTKVYSCYNNKSDDLRYVVAVTNTGKRTLTSVDIQYTLKKNGKKVDSSNTDEAEYCVLPPKKTIYIPLEMSEIVPEYMNVYRHDGVDSDGNSIDTFLGCYPMTGSDIDELEDRKDYYYYTESTGIYDVSGYSLSVNVKPKKSTTLYPFTKTKTINTSGKIKSGIKNKKIKKDSAGVYYLKYKYKPFKTGKKCIENDEWINVIYYDKKGRIVGASFSEFTVDGQGAIEEPASYKIITYGYQVNKK
ncbi:MAG: hypothetical protein K6E64_06930 [Lachnospiraceae bacterium]|nr:hypothetical protein [Lachnospiraceae bacterium]